MSKPKIFIDGSHGTTGLQIHERIKTRSDIEIVAISEAKRKDPQERKNILNSVDLTILCLPDNAAREAVSLIENTNVKILDASTAHRVHPDWVYGFPELSKGHADKIRKATKVANPGCYSTGAIALLNPLIASEIIPADYPLSIHGISGYSGGGNALIELCEKNSTLHPKPYFRTYGLKLNHKHLPEIKKYSGLKHAPIFVPSYVGNMRQGMLVEIPLYLDNLPNSPTAEQIHAVLSVHYSECPFVKIAPYCNSEQPDEGLSPDKLNNTDMMELYVFANSSQQALLVAQLDNLGKGASGAAVQNMKLMLGLN